MNNQIRGNNACKNCCKEFANDCFNTLYDTSIMVDNRITPEIEGNRYPLRYLRIEQRERVVDSMSDITDSNKRYSKIGKIYLVRNINRPVNQSDLKNTVKTVFKYDYYRNHFLSVIKALLIVLQLYVSIIMVNSKNKNVKLWGKVDAFLFLRLIYFSCYDIEYTFCDLYFSSKLKKIKCNKYFMICYQTIGIIFKLAMYIIITINTKNSFKAKHNRKGFLTETLEIIIIIIGDFLKFLIK